MPALDDLVVAFERRQPDCTLSLQEVDLSDSMGPLQAGEIDVMVTASMQNRFGNDRVVVIPIRDMAPVPLGLIWRTAHENARIAGLGAASA